MFLLSITTTFRPERPYGHVGAQAFYLARVFSAKARGATRSFIPGNRETLQHHGNVPTILLPQAKWVVPRLLMTALPVPDEAFGLSTK